MPRKPELPVSKRHVTLFDSDWEYLCRLYGPGGAKPVGVSEVIRKLIHTYCNRLRAMEAEARGALEGPSAPGDYNQL